MNKEHQMKSIMRTMKLALLILLGFPTLAYSVEAQTEQAPQIINWSDHGSRLVIVENEQLTIYDQSLNPIVAKDVSEISDSQILWVQLSPSGDRLFVAFRPTGGVILDSSTLLPQVEFNDTEIIPSTAQWSNDGTEIAFRYRDGLGRSIYATDTGQKLREFYDLDGWRDPYELVWSPNGDVFASFASEHVIILDAQDGSIVDSFDIEEGINDVSWSPDGDEIAVSTLAVVPLGTENSYPTSSLSAHRNSVYILDASDGTTVTTITGLADGINTVVWSADGSQIAGPDSWRSLYLWDATDGTLLDSFLTRPFEIRSLYFSEYGGRLIVVYGSRTASARDDRDFIPLSTFAVDAFDNTLQYYVPAPSATRMEDILSRCVADPAIAAEGSGYIASEQWGVFLQWLDAQPPNILPLTCADDLQLITEVLIGDNQAPIALAGVDQALTDTDNNGSEAVTLDGSASSDSDGTITNYVWTENSTQIATGATPTVDLTVGTHTITLTVTDDDGLTATDEVVITVNPPTSVTCDATVTASDVSGLVSAISTANGSGGADTICLEASNYTLNAVQNNNYGTNGLPAITSEITLVGLGGGATIERAGGSPSFRFFRITSGGTLQNNTG